MRKLCTSLLLVLLTAVSLYADNPKDYASWWIKNYGVVDSKIDPLVARTEKVFERVSAAADKMGTRFPRFVIINASGDPYAQVIKDGTVILTHGGLKICYRGVAPEKGDARLAFVLGHELAHLAKDDFWHSSAFAAVREYGDEKRVKEELMNQLKWDIADPKTQEFIRIQELQADSYGLIYMTMAGYDPKAIIDKDKTNFFEDWGSQITGKIAYSDVMHPGPVERAGFLRTQLGPVVDALNYFSFGVRLYQLGRYSDAILLLEAFKQKFPSREVSNNIGLCHYQLAMRELSACSSGFPGWFKLSAIVDPETLATRIIRGPALYILKPFDETSSWFQKQTYLKYIYDATRYLEMAVKADPTYLAARINLSSALIMAKEYSKALSAVDESLKVHPQNLEILNNKAIALYLFGKTQNIDTADNAIEILKEISGRNPSYTDPLFNMATIQSGRDRNAAFETMEKWMKSTEKPDIKSDNTAPVERSPETNSPIKLGEIKGETEKALRGMKLKGFSFGALKGEIYEGSGIKVLAIDDTVEIVETQIDKPTDFTKFKKTQGEPVKKVKNFFGMTLIYNDFGVDVVDGPSLLTKTDPFVLVRSDP